MGRKKSKGPSIAGYFRKLFMENPALLEHKTNDQILNHYRKDHGMAADAVVEKRVKDAMANTKSQLKKKLGAGGKLPATGVKQKMTARVSAGTANMEVLEELIDECMTMARTLDKEGLNDVIRHLRRARNKIIWRLGEPAS